MADVLNQEDIDWLLDDADNYDLEDCYRSITDATHIFKEHNEYVKVPYRVFSDMLINLKKFKQLLESERAERIKKATKEVSKTKEQQ